MIVDKKQSGLRKGRRSTCSTKTRHNFIAARPAQSTQSGWVFNFQQFSIEDGPGLRTTMFLKGCPLHCPWCSNPESMSALPQIKFALNLCRGCGTCALTCPEGCLSIDDTNKVLFDHAGCTQCMKCLRVCPSGCISSVGISVTRDHALDMLLKDKPFYENTGGGVTISGGEPLFQYQFTAGILRDLKARGVHTAVDTTGYAQMKAVRMVLEYADLVLYDIKHLDPARHKEAVGVGNEIILKNLRACKGLSEIWLRTPLIPGFNDDPRHMEAVIDLGREVGASRCYFLPFHRWGEHKYARLGFPNAYRKIREFTTDEITGLKERFRKWYGYVFFEKA